MTQGAATLKGFVEPYWIECVGGPADGFRADQQWQINITHLFFRRGGVLHLKYTPASAVYTYHETLPAGPTRVFKFAGYNKPEEAQACGVTS